MKAIKIKAVIVLIILSFLCQGCGVSRVATGIGVRTGDSYIESAKKGEVSACESIKAWPYISGLIKGIYSDNYDIEMTPVIKKVMEHLDDLSYKTEPLTNDEKGFVIGSFCRLEYEAIKLGWDRYGINIYNMVF